MGTRADGATWLAEGRYLGIAAVPRRGEFT